jgi:ABC-type nitrate/sulfonate/bicarbonate transport system substrate-binding protein
MTDAALNFTRALAEAEDETLENLEAAADILSDAQRDQRMQDKAILRRLRWPDALQADPPDNDR